MELLAVAPVLGVTIQVITDEESLSLEIEVASLSSTALSVGSAGFAGVASLALDEAHCATFARVAKKSAAPSEGAGGEEEDAVALAGMLLKVGWLLSCKAL